MTAVTDAVARQLIARYLGAASVAFPVRVVLFAVLLIAGALLGAAAAVWRIAAEFGDIDASGVLVGTPIR